MDKRGGILRAGGRRFLICTSNGEREAPRPISQVLLEL